MTNFTLSGIETSGKSTVTTDATLTTATLPGSSAVNLAAVDCLKYQSITVQVLGTWVGTMGFEVSNDGTTWVTKSLVSAGSAAIASSTGSNGLYFGDIGARYFRARFTAWTSGTATIVANISAFSYAPPVGTVGVGTPVLASNNTEITVTTTNLGASATYTQTAVDLGTTVSTRPSRIRPVVSHLAGLVPGHLILQESVDNTTWRETRRSPIPSDGVPHSFDWPLHMRYHRLLFVNGSTAQTAFFLQTLTMHGEGSSADANNTLVFPLSTTALGAGSSFTSSTFDLGGNQSWRKITALVRTDQASAANGFRIDYSNDGTTFYGDPEAIGAVVANVGMKITASVAARFFRVNITNGAVAQTILSLGVTLTDS